MDGIALWAIQNSTMIIIGKKAIRRQVALISLVDTVLWALSAFLRIALWAIQNSTLHSTLPRQNGQYQLSLGLFGQKPPTTAALAIR